MTRDDRAALDAVARRWQVKPSEVIRITIRALAEAVDAQGLPVPVGPRHDDAPKGQGAADEH